MVQGQYALAVAVVCALLAIAVRHQRTKLGSPAFWITQHAENASMLSAQRPAASCAVSRAPYVCAHGGDTTKYPPNTASAHAAAIAEGVDCIEIDVSLTADSQLIAMHDRDLKQLTRRSDALVHDFSLEQLLLLTWHSGEPVLTVSQALSAVAPHVDLVVLDVKTSQPPRIGAARDGSAVSEETVIAQLLLDLLSTTGCNNTLIWGKSDAMVEHIKQSAPAQMAGYTVMLDCTGTAAHFEDPLRPNMRNTEVAAVHHGMLNSSLMDKLTGANKSVFAWTVDDPRDMQHMLDVGVLGIVTNRPKLLQEAIKSRCQKYRAGDRTTCRVWSK